MYTVSSTDVPCITHDINWDVLHNVAAKMNQFRNTRNITISFLAIVPQKCNFVSETFPSN